MTTQELIEAHEKCIEVLEAIRTFERFIKSAHENIDGFAGTFPELRRKYIHRIEIYQMCITRLQERYSKINNQIK